MVFVEKVIIGENSIQYQLVAYTPDRVQLVVNDFEVVAEGKPEKTSLGFHAAGPQEPQHVVELHMKDDKLYGVRAPSNITINKIKIQDGDLTGEGHE